MQARVDLHVHSPAGGDYRGDVRTSIPQIHERCREVGLDLVVVADHMTLDGWSSFACPLDPEPPLVLPGAEIKLSREGLRVHLVAIFEPLTAQETFARVLDALAPFVSDEEAFSAIEITADPAFVLETLHQVGAICLAAHLDRLGDGARALAMLEEAGGVEAVEFDRIETAEDFSPNGLPRITCSDSHSLEEIGRRYTELFLDELSFEGLSKALRSGDSAVAGHRLA